MLRDNIVRGNDGKHNTFCQDKQTPIRDIKECTAKIQYSVVVLTTLQRRVVFPYAHRQNPLVTLRCHRAVP